jgi:integrase
MPLTAKQVEHIKATSNRVEIPAGPPNGLYLVVQPTGAKSWALRYRLRGRPTKLTLKKYPEMTLAQARAEAVAALDNLANGIDPAEVHAEEVRREEPNGFRETAEEWLEREVKPKTRTWREVERIVKREIIPAFSGKLITQVEKPDAHRLLDKIKGRGAGIIANHTLSILKRYFNWAIERGYVQASPVSGIKPPVKTKSRERVLTPAELVEAWAAAKKVEYPYGPFLKVILLTAQRRGEVAEMRWQDVDLERKLWKLSADQTKAGRVHDVPLSPAVVGILSHLPRFRGPFVFTTTSGEKPINSFSDCRNALDAAILADKPKGTEAPDYVIHDFRRTATSWLAEHGLPPHVLSALLNHSPGAAQGVLSIYNRFRYLDERREALERWAKHLSSLPKQKARRVS